MSETPFIETVEELRAAFDEARRTRRILLDRARTLNRARHDAEAADAYRQVLADTPTSAEAWTGLSRIWLADGRPADALDAALRGFALEPRSAFVHYSLG